MKSPFKEKDLRTAARIYVEKREAALEAVLDHDPVIFSPLFQRKMDEIIRNAEAAVIKHRKLRVRIATVVVVLILFIASYFSFNTTASAAFTNWIKEQFGNITKYFFIGENDEKDLPRYEPKWIPEGLIREDDFSDHTYSLLFQNPDTEEGFIFDCVRASEGAGLFVIDDEARQHFAMKIAEWEVDCYTSSESNDYIWHDADNRFFFSINSNLPHEVNIKIIENITLVNP